MDIVSLSGNFSMNLRKGPGQDNVPDLLRTVADFIEREQLAVEDIVFTNGEITEDGEWPVVTVYYEVDDETMRPTLKRSSAGTDQNSQESY